VRRCSLTQRDVQTSLLTSLGRLGTRTSLSDPRIAVAAVDNPTRSFSTTVHIQATAHDPYLFDHNLAAFDHNLAAFARKLAVFVRKLAVFVRNQVAFVRSLAVSVCNPTAFARNPCLFAHNLASFRIHPIDP
jgi:hypothetical protein